MTNPYVELQDGIYRVAHSRVSLDTVVREFLRGQTAESIAQSLPAVTLEHIYGALAYYLANRAAVDAYLQQADVEFGVLRKAARDSDPMFYQKLADARRHAA
jgi:uncharacterized protein (DUF433 family)